MRSAFQLRRMSRRRLLQAGAAAGVGAAALALVGCGEDEDAEGSQEEQQAAQEQAGGGQQAAQGAQQAAQQQSRQQGMEEQGAELQAEQQTGQQAGQEGTAQEQAEGGEEAGEAATGPTAGGTMRLYLPIERWDSWDPHRSRFRYAQTAHSLVYSRLVQPADPYSGELAGDLCGLPETPDATTYVFTLDASARWWDRAPTEGRAVEVEDIRLNIERQQQGVDAEGQPDPHFFRSGEWNRAVFADEGEGSFRLTTDGADAPFLGSVAGSPFAWMISREAIEGADGWLANPYDAALVSGSGPYAPTAFDPGGELRLARSGNWWGEAVWPEEIVFSGGPTDEIVGAFFSAEVDWAGFPLTNEVVEGIRERAPEHRPLESPLDAPVQLLAPAASDAAAALGDPRVVRAIAIAVDRERLIGRLYGGRGRASGPLPWYLEGWALGEEQLAGYAGYRRAHEEDAAEASQLIAAAGGAEQVGAAPFVAADLFEGFFPGAGAFVRDQVEAETGLGLELEFRPFAEALGALEGGERFVFLGWGATPRGPDPTDWWLGALHSAGAENWGGAGDAELDGLIEQMQGTFDMDARRDLCQQAQMRLLSGESPGWVFNLANGVQLGAGQSWLHLDERALSYAWWGRYLGASWLDRGAESGYPAGARDVVEEG